MSLLLQNHWANCHALVLDRVVNVHEPVLDVFAVPTGNASQLPLLLEDAALLSGMSGARAELAPLLYRLLYGHRLHGRSLG